jgi:hypothetical protein
MPKSTMGTSHDTGDEDPCRNKPTDQNEKIVWELLWGLPHHNTIHGIPLEFMKLVSMGLSV